MQLQELLSATRAEVQIRGANIQILEENLAARRRRDVALTIADDEGQTVRFVRMRFSWTKNVFMCLCRSWSQCVGKLNISLLKTTACNKN
jgi:hypothetical protein